MSGSALLTTAFTVPPSPSINFTETAVPSTIIQGSTTQATLAGLFRWGPVNTIGLVSSQNGLANTFGTPTNLNAETFFSGWNYLAYANELFVTRTVANDVLSALAISSAANSAVSNSAVTIYNQDDYAVKVGNSGLTSNSSVLWAAKYPGALGDSLLISVCDSANAYSQDVFAAANGNSINTAAVNATFNVGSSTATFSFQANTTDANTFATKVISVGDYLRVGNSSLGYQDLQINTINAATTSVQLTFGSKYILGANITANSTTIANSSTYLWRFWQYFNTVAGAPGTTPYVAARGGVGDAVHVVVIDQDGLLTGNPGQVLNAYQNLSRATDAQTATGTLNYYATYINQVSQYVWWMNDRQANYSNTSANITALNTMPYTASFAAGSDGASTEANVAPAVVQAGYQLVADTEAIAPLLYIQGKPIGGSANTQLANYIVGNISSVRRDNITVASPDSSFVVNNKGSEALSIINGTAAALTPSTYLLVDSGYKYQYDQYNNVYRYVPLCGDTAGLIAATNNSKGVGWSPAGYNRGIYKNVTKLPYSPKKFDRDLLFPAGINPVVSQQGSGTVLLGDQTFWTDQSNPFNSVGVRLLFITLEVALSTAAKQYLFEFNNSFTQQLFRNMVNPYLATYTGTNGVIRDFVVVCDSTNNTDQVVSSMGFVGDIYILPARGIRYIQLNFYAIGSDAAFKEIVGSNPSVA